MTMAITTIGSDRAMSVFQAHGVDENGATVLVKRRHRARIAWVVLTREEAYRPYQLAA
jgi:hypothetical protein|tara:strand:- start:19947 stop:20120 length:174 start_codon:yes stop_codon:yes gene_type:complete